jgi:cob(I)alamin adenosyltransferase
MREMSGMADPITQDAGATVGRDESERRGLLIVNTGSGKGKTTAALGVMFRAWGWGWRMCMIQFIKSAKGRWGERRAAGQLGIEWHSLGTGFTWTSKDPEKAMVIARQTWALAKEKIASDAYDLIVLDELTHLLKLGWLDTNEVVGWLAANRPAHLHLIITGRDAPAALVDLADLVTDMASVKHPFEQGVRAQKGIEF